MGRVQSAAKSSATKITRWNTSATHQEMDTHQAQAVTQVAATLSRARLVPAAAVAPLAHHRPPVAAAVKPPSIQIHRPYTTSTRKWIETIRIKSNVLFIIVYYYCLWLLRLNTGCRLYFIPVSTRTVKDA